MSDMKIVAGLDVGNGYVKGKASVNGVGGKLVDMPSAVSYTIGSDIPKPATNDYMEKLVNELDATVTSRAIKAMDAGRVFFGERAIRTGESLREFNIENHVPKCQDALSTMLVLGSIASLAIQGYWAENGSLPGTSLGVDACIGIALPIEDFMDWKDAYRDTLMGDVHHVIVHNFDHDIDVSVRFVDVEVLAEGAAAQYAISSMGAEFLQLALDEPVAMARRLTQAIPARCWLVPRTPSASTSARARRISLCSRTVPCPSSLRRASTRAMARF